MFKIKVNNLVFSFIMAIFMVYGMTLYNVALEKSFTYDLLYVTIIRMLPEFVVAYIILNFFAFPITEKIISLMKIDKNNKLLEILLMTIFTVLLMATTMSLFVVILHNGISKHTPAIWLSKVILNIPFAFCLQLFIVGPLVRFIFSKIHLVTRIFARA